MWKILRKFCSKTTCFWSLYQTGYCITPSSIENWNFCWWVRRLSYFWFSQIGSFVFRWFIMDTLEIDKGFKEFFFFLHPPKSVFIELNTETIIVFFLFIWLQGLAWWSLVNLKGVVFVWQFVENGNLGLSQKRKRINKHDFSFKFKILFILIENNNLDLNY